MKAKTLDTQTFILSEDLSYFDHDRIGVMMETLEEEGFNPMMLHVPQRIFYEEFKTEDPELENSPFLFCGLIVYPYSGDKVILVGFSELDDLEDIMKTAVELEL